MDALLPEYKNGQNADAWWVSIFKNPRYPALRKLAMVCFSCFHGPAVESSFNTMGEVIDVHSTRTKIHTYSAFQTVKYALQSRKSTSLEVFRKGDIKHDEVNPKIVNNFASSARHYKNEKESHRRSKEEKLSSYRKNEIYMKSRAEQIRIQREAENIARLAHQRVMKRKQTKEILMSLAKRRKTAICS